MEKIVNETNSTSGKFKKNLLNWKNYKDRIKIIFQLISIFLSILIMILSSIISYDSEVSKSIAAELIDNFETGYFMDFNDQGIGEIVKFGKWQGTVKGCGIIEYPKKYAVRLNEGERCEKSEVLEPISEKDIIIYKNLTLYASTKGKYLDLLYEKDTIINESQICPDGKKLCGYIDTLKNKLCVNNGSQCPISYIVIREIKSNDSNTIDPQIFKNITTKYNNNSLVFFYSNNPYPNGTEIPYIANSFKIADSPLCALPNLYYSKIPLHALDGNKNKYSIDCVLKDYSQKVVFDVNRYHKINEVNNYNLYEENKIIEMINNSKLKEYGFNIDIYKYNTLNLYIRTHFGFDKTCLDDMNFKYENLIYIHSRAAKMLVYGDWAYFSIVIIFFSITNFFSFTGLFLPDLQSLETLIKNFVNFGSSFGLLFYSYYAIDYDDYFEKEMKCSDVITNNNYNIMVYKVNRSGSIITWTFRIYLILFINILISVI